MEEAKGPLTHGQLAKLRRLLHEYPYDWPGRWDFIARALSDTCITGVGLEEVVIAVAAIEPRYFRSDVEACYRATAASAFGVIIVPLKADGSALDVCPFCERPLPFKPRDVTEGGRSLFIVTDAHGVDSATLFRRECTSCPASGGSRLIFGPSTYEVTTIRGEKTLLYLPADRCHPGMRHQLAVARHRRLLFDANSRLPAGHERHRV
jgi:hypothetical protein